MTAPAAILWDIDGTLLRAPGSGVRAFTDALHTVTGLEFPATPIDMGGRTDPDIGSLILAAAGHTDPATLPLLLAEVERAWAAREHEFREITEVKPGIARALGDLAALGTVQTLVTGNLESVARRKIAIAGLGNELRMELGGYGSDHPIRHELVRLSCRRISDAGHTVALEDTWVVGDTHRDLACARAAGVRCILVATGMQPYEELAALDADAVFADLSDVAAFVTALGF